MCSLFVGIALLQADEPVSTAVGIALLQADEPVSTARAWFESRQHQPRQDVADHDRYKHFDPAVSRAIEPACKSSQWFYSHQ
jgi:hypothetical protein